MRSEVVHEKAVGLPDGAPRIGDGVVMGCWPAWRRVTARPPSRRRPRGTHASKTLPTGYWMAASDGSVFARVPFAAVQRLHGARTRLNTPIVGMAVTPSSTGYWLVASDGGVFSFGDASFFGSMGGTRLNAPVVGMAASPTGKGYWLVAAPTGGLRFRGRRVPGLDGRQGITAPWSGWPPPDRKRLLAGGLRRGRICLR